MSFSSRVLVNLGYLFAPMGVLAHRLRTLDRSLVPPSTQAEIFRHTCLQSHLQTSPPTPRKTYLKFRNPRTTFEILKILKTAQRGQGGVSKFVGACVCRVTFKHLLQPLRSHTRSFGTLGQLLEIPPFVRPSIA